MAVYAADKRIFVGVSGEIFEFVKNFVSICFKPNLNFSYQKIEYFIFFELFVNGFL